MKSFSQIVLALALAPLGTACTGQVMGSAPGSGPAAGDPVAPGAATGGLGGAAGSGSGTDSRDASQVDCSKPPPLAATPLGRLSAFEYGRTVQALFPQSQVPAFAFGAEATVLGYDNNPSAQGVDVSLVEQYESSASNLASTQLGSALSGCDVTSADGDTCVADWVKTFGRRVFRRALPTDEAERYAEFYATSKAAWGATDAARMLLQALLQSAPFLYRFEQGTTLADGTVVLDGTSRAARLAYFMTGAPPAEPLLARAEQGLLDTSEGMRSAAQELLTDAAARSQVLDGLTHFVEGWLELGGVAPLKNEQAFPDYAAAFPAMVRETRSYLGGVVLDGDGALGTLLSSRKTFGDAAVAALYGVSSATSGVFDFALPADRAGILTQPRVMSTHAKASDTSIVKRGKFVFERVLCAEPPPPPANIPPLPDAATGAVYVTQRERLEQHVKNPACAACHLSLDAPGFAFEHFDAAGAWREQERGAAIDSSAVLNSTDVDGPVSGAVELVDRLAASVQVRHCFVNQVFRYAVRRSETGQDSCDFAALDASAEQPDNLRRILVELAATRAFGARVAPPKAP